MENSGIVIVGCGPHYRTRYHALVRERVAAGKLSVAAVIDLASQKENVLAFAKENALDPGCFVFLDEKLRDPPSPEALAEVLPDAMLREHRAEMVLISSEPKSHRAYALWALSHGLQVYSDKPVTAPHDGHQTFSFEAEIDELISARDKAGVRYVVSCERRMNPGYLYVFNVLRDLISKYRVPVTGVHIHFAGGVWNTPYEYGTRENHPYKYGYGVLLHSGYHYVDLLCRTLDLNKGVISCEQSPSSVNALTRTPAAIADFHPPLPEYSSGKTALDGISGETDVLVNGRVRGQNGFEAVFSLDMTDISVSRRTNGNAMDNPYVQGGRLRQETVIVHLGHLCSLRISTDSLPPQDPRTCENFTVTIIKNDALAESELAQRLGRRSIGREVGFPDDRIFNVHARLAQLRDFLDGGDGCSPLHSHRTTATYLDAFRRAVRDNDW